jgi:hypothetical protein
MSRQVIRDSYGKEIGYYVEQHNGDIKVYDNKTKYLGEARDDGTFDSYGKKISSSKEPGLLLHSC